MARVIRRLRTESTKGGAQSSRAHLVCAFLSFCLVASSAERAGAQPKTSGGAAAEALFQEARQLIAAGRHADACPKLEESLRLDPAPGTRLNLADCYEHVGRFASAWALFSELATATHLAGLRDKEQLARERAAALEPKLSKILIEVPRGVAALAGLRIRRDGGAVDRGAWGVAQPVDPGAHRIEASAPGKEPWSETVEVSAPGMITVRIGIQGDPTPTQEVVRVETVDALGPQRVAGIAIGGAGVAGVVVGAVFGLRASSKHGEAQDEHCPTPGRCDQRGVELTEEAQSAAAVSTVAFILGGVAVAGGAVLFLTAPSPSATTTSTRMRLTPIAGLRSGELRLEGRW